MGLFFKDKKPPTREKISEKIQKSQPVSIISTGPTPVDMVGTTTVGDKDYNKQIDDLIEANNQEGFDYLEFAKNINNSLPLTEEQKYQAAGQILSSMKIDVNIILMSANLYIKRIDEYKDKFDVSMARSKEEEISKKQESIANKQKLIQQLTVQIQEESGNIQRMTEEIDVSNNKLKAHETAFNRAVDNRKSLINLHINNIKTYLQKPSKP